MPELPEVQTVVAGLAGPLARQVIRRCQILRPDIIRTVTPRLPDRLLHRRIDGIERQGKRIILRLSPPASLVFHLGMSGRLTLEHPGTPLAPHTHARLGFDTCPLELRFRDPRRFGGIWFSSGESSNGAGLSPLGPDALTIRATILSRLLLRRRQVKALLLDQRIISGLGNIYVDESLFRAGIHPLSVAEQLRRDEINRLACSIRKTLHLAIASGGSTLLDYRRADGLEGDFQRQLQVYGRDGQPCLRCGARIRRIIAAGRSTHFCPRCQKPRRRRNETIKLPLIRTSAPAPGSCGWR